MVLISPRPYIKTDPVCIQRCYREVRFSLIGTELYGYDDLDSHEPDTYLWVKSGHWRKYHTDGGRYKSDENPTFTDVLPIDDHLGADIIIQLMDKDLIFDDDLMCHGNIGSDRFLEELSDYGRIETDLECLGQGSAVINFIVGF